MAWGQPWTLPCAEKQERTWTFRLDASASGNAGQHPYAREADTWDGAEGTGERGGASWCCWYPRPMFSGSVQRKRPPDLVPALTQPPTPPRSLPACPGSAPRGVRGRPAPSAGTAGGDVLPAASPSRGAPEPPPGWRWGPAPPSPHPPEATREKECCWALLCLTVLGLFFFVCLYFSLQPPPFTNVFHYNSRIFRHGKTFLTSNNTLPILTMSKHLVFTSFPPQIALQ